MLMQYVFNRPIEKKNNGLTNYDFSSKNMFHIYLLLCMKHTFKILETILEAISVLFAVQSVCKWLA